MLKPTTIPELQEAVLAHDRVLAVGARTKPRLSELGDADAATTARIDTTGLSGITEYDPAEFTFSALAGTPAAEVEAALADRGQFLPFAPLYRGSGATLGGTVAAGFGGPGRFRFGGVRDFILAVRFIDGNGRLITAGGRVVKNVAGFDIPKLLVGSLGRLGILAELTFKVFPRPVSLLTLRCSCPDSRLATERIVAASRSRWEIQAIDYHPANQEILVRLGGPAEANAAIARDIKDNWGSGITNLPASEGDQVWETIRELRWTAGAEVVVKVPITPREITPLEGGLKEIPGARAHYSAGGNVAKIALARKSHIADLDRVLRQLDLRGLTFIGDAATPLWFGDRAEPEIAQAIKKVMDPSGRFPEL